MAITTEAPQASGNPPARFRSAEARGYKLSRGLRWFGGIDATVDEALMARIGRALRERDEPGAALAAAIQTRAGTPGHVSHAQLQQALRTGSPADAPDALRDFMELVNTVPGWVDWDQVDRGARLLARFGQNAADVLTQLSLIGGYRFGGVTDFLVATGGLTGGRTLRRLAETQFWTASLSKPGALAPGGEAWQLTVHVRCMHAIVNRGMEPKWDVDRWGLPVNQADQAGTLALFDATVLLGCRALGVAISEADAAAYMHMWHYVGWLLGVHPDFLTEDESERNRITYHLLLAAPDISEAGPQLSKAIFAVQADRDYRGWPKNGLRIRWEQERMLSMLTGFLGAESVRELELTPRPPWAFAYLIPLNTLRYRICDRLPGGERRREQWGRANIQRILESYFKGQAFGVGRLSQ
ncbi:MAG: DUF2236 domain-containing protein [Solirubrobacterales bacterium]|nr:DUF2236 domain-containing protein [Solirubrobacterales bacterium]